MLFLEWKRTPKQWWKLLVFLFIGSILSGITILPTVIQYFDVVFNNIEGNIAFNPARVGKIFDLLTRYFTFATFDVTQTYFFYQLASEQSIITSVLLRFLKIIAIIQFVVFWISFYYLRKNILFRKIFILFILTLLMALFLFVISNKHLAIRTYILLYPVPIWMSLFVYNFLFKYKYIKIILYSSLFIVFVTFIGVAATNYNAQYSFKSVENQLKTAIETKTPNEFGKRRVSLMDKYK